MSSISRYGTTYGKDLSKAVQSILINVGGAKDESFVKRDGSNPLTGDLPCGGFRLTGSAAGVNPNDLEIKSVVDGVQASADSALTQAQGVEIG